MPLCHAANASVLGPPSPVRRIRQQYQLGPQAEHDQGLRAGPSTDERDRIKALERENRELRQANKILRKASAYFAQAELDRRWKP